MGIEANTHNGERTPEDRIHDANLRGRELSQLILAQSCGITFVIGHTNDLDSLVSRGLPASYEDNYGCINDIRERLGEFHEGIELSITVRNEFMCATFGPELRPDDIEPELSLAVGA